MKRKSSSKINSNEDDQDDTETSRNGSEDNTPKRGRKSKRSKNEDSSEGEENNVSDLEDPLASPEEDAEYEVDKILDEKNVKGVKHYLIRWKGYTEEEDTWEPASTLTCDNLIEQFKNNKQDGKGTSSNSKKEKHTEAKKKKDKRKKSDKTEDEEEEDFDDNKEVPKKTKKKKADKTEEEDADSSEEFEVPKKTKKKKADKTEEEDADSSEELEVPKKTKKKKADKTEEEDADSSEEFEVLKILDVHFCRDGKREFLVRWKGYTADDDTWEPENNLECKDLIEKFMQKVEKARHVDTKDLRVNRKQTERLNFAMHEKGRKLSRRHKDKERVTYFDAE